MNNYMTPNKSRFTFEPIEKYYRSNKETIRISSHIVSVTKGLYQKMGKPEYLAFYFDAEERAVAIKKVDATNQNAVQIRTYKSAFQAIKGGFIKDRIFKELNIQGDDKSVILQHGYKDGDYYVFELRYADVMPIERRRRKHE